MPHLKMGLSSTPLVGLNLISPGIFNAGRCRITIRYRSIQKRPNGKGEQSPSEMAAQSLDQ